jgi:MFS family permease
MDTNEGFAQKIAQLRFHKPYNLGLHMRQAEKEAPGVPFYRLLVIICTITFVCYLATSMRLPIVPLYARGLGITTTQIGIINSTFYLMAGLLSLPLGLVSDIIGRRWLSISGLIIVSGCLGLLFVSRSFLQLTAIYILLGIGVAAFGPTMMSSVAKISPLTHLGRAYGWYTTALFCGISIGPAVAGVLGHWLGLRPVFLISAALCGVNVLLLLKYMPYRSLEPGGHGRHMGWASDLRYLIGNLPLLGCWVATFGANIIGGMFFTFLPLHAQNKGLNVNQIGIVFFSQALINALSRIPFGYFSDRVENRKYLVLAGIVLMTFSIAGFSLTETFAHFLIVALGLGTSMGLAFTSIGALITETVPDRFRGLAMGGYNTSIYWGMMVGSILFGSIIEATSFGFGFRMAGLLNLIFIVIFYRFMHAFQPSPSAAGDSANGQD